MEAAFQGNSYNPLKEFSSSFRGKHDGNRT